MGSNQFVGLLPDPNSVVKPPIAISNERVEKLQLVDELNLQIEFCLVHGSTLIRGVGEPEERKDIELYLHQSEGRRYIGCLEDKAGMERTRPEHSEGNSVIFRQMLTQVFP